MKAAGAVKTAAWWGAVVVWMGGIWWLSDQPDLRSGLAADFLLRKLAHVAEFAVLTGLVYRAGRSLLYRQPAVYLASSSWAGVYAVVDEWHQSWVFGRHSSLGDVAIDCLGILLALVLLHTRDARSRSSRSATAP